MASREMQDRLEKLQNELLYMLAKAGIVMLASLTLLVWLIEKMDTLMIVVPGVVVLVALLYVVVRWLRAYFRLRKEFYNLEKQFRQQLEASTGNREDNPPLIVFRRH